MDAEGGKSQRELVKRLGIKTLPALAMVKPCGRGIEVAEGVTAETLD